MSFTLLVPSDAFADALLAPGRHGAKVPQLERLCGPDGPLLAWGDADFMQPSLRDVPFAGRHWLHALVLADAEGIETIGYERARWVLAAIERCPVENGLRFMRAHEHETVVMFYLIGGDGGFVSYASGSVLAFNTREADYIIPALETAGADFALALAIILAARGAGEAVVVALETPADTVAETPMPKKLLTVTVIQPDGTTTAHDPTSARWTLAELRALVGGDFQQHRDPRNPARDVVVFNTNGTVQHLPSNPEASKLFGHALVGPVLFGPRAILN